MGSLPIFETPDLVLGITACAMSVILMTLYPLPTSFRIVEEKSTGGLKPYPYCFTQLACFLWIFYGFSEPVVRYQYFLVIYINTICLIFQTCYLVIYKDNTTTTYNGLFIELVVFIPEFIFILVTVPWHQLLYSPHIIGSAAAIGGIIMYASPIPSIIDAYKTRTTNYLPLGLCTLYFLNAVAWFAYAYLYTPTYNGYLAVAHGAGIILEIVQLLVSCILLVKFRTSSGSSATAAASKDSAPDIEAPLLHD